MRECAHCGNGIPPERPRAKYCSPSCAGYAVAARRGQVGRVDYECGHCGRIWEDYAGNKRTYCSRSCADEVKRTERPACLVCGDPVRLMRNRYCSKRCSNAARPLGEPGAWSTIYGRLQRAFPNPEPCALCGDPGEARHHFDYNRINDITWLCRTCHQHVHNQGVPTRRKKVRGIRPGTPA